MNRTTQDWLDHEARIRRIRAALHYRRELLEDELNDRVLRRLVAAERFVRIIHGCYVDASVWAEMPVEDRRLARTLAVAHLNHRRRPVFSHHSAATIWGLPFYGLDSPRVHILTRDDSPGHSSHGVSRHIGRWNDDDVQEVEGMLVTSITRTLLDLARSAKPELAIACADAGLRKLFRARRDSSLDALAAWRRQQNGTLLGLRGYPGAAHARKIVEEADPRADSPAESVSRLQIRRLEIPCEIQAPVTMLDGARSWMDFEFLGQCSYGEMDGAVKYLDPAFRNGRTLDEVLIDEKRREDEVRGITGYRVLRWGFDSIRTARILGLRLQAYGIRVPRLE